MELTTIPGNWIFHCLKPLGFHGPGDPSEGKQTRQDLYPARIAAAILGKETRLGGLVLRPGGQLTRQNILVVLHALIESLLV
jgi:hypothetical protein